MRILAISVFVLTCLVVLILQLRAIFPNDAGLKKADQEMLKNLGATLARENTKHLTQPIPTADIIGSNWTAICILTPYENRFDDNHPAGKAANAALHAAKIDIADELEFVIVLLLEDGGHRIIRAPRTAEVDFVGNVKKAAPGLTERYEPSSCGYRHSAYIVPYTSSSGRNNFYLWEKK
ncbi:hypothetical protein [Ferrovibrio sp.]|uniref:hypothetical protein n=1 Tax=Ferrovibrio sp. TaxID=1917215 RepID=UPI003D0D46EB